MSADQAEEELLRSVAIQNAKSILAARERMERDLLEAKHSLERRTEELAKSEAQYRSALKAGRLVYWETDLANRTRTWTPEAMALFGLNLADGRGQLGGDQDEFKRAMHPNDRHLAKTFYELADKQDWFPAEYRIIKPDGTIRWLSGGGEVVSRDLNGKALRLMNVVADVSERKFAEEHRDVLMRELTHRAKNLLAVIQSIATQTGRSTSTFEDFQSRFMLRLQGLAASHDLLVLQNWQGASLAELVHNQLAPFIEQGSDRIRASGPDMMLTPKATEAIGLAFHELATNAVKYGALSGAEGNVSITWTSLNDRKPGGIVLDWLERGGPSVRPPVQKGFGHIVCQRVVTDLLGGTVEMDYASEGLNWRLSIPSSNLVKN